MKSWDRKQTFGKAHTYIEGQADPEEPADLKIFGLSCHDFKFIYRKNNLNIYVHKISNKPTIKAQIRFSKDALDLGRYVEKWNGQV